VFLELLVQFFLLSIVKRWILSFCFHPLTSLTWTVNFYYIDKSREGFQMMVVKFFRKSYKT